MLAIGFDADDTLWHNETLFAQAQEEYRRLLAPYHDAHWVDERLYATEMRNLAHFGYGIKGFTLSMIETAIELTEGRITGREIEQILDFAKEMVAAPVELLPGVEQVVSDLAETHPLLLITKGDLFDQESKLARSGLADYFQHVEIVREKAEDVYAALLQRHAIAPADFLMVGNSLRSDILPVLALGGEAVYIPYKITWAHEATSEPVKEEGFHSLETIEELPELVGELAAPGAQ